MSTSKKKTTAKTASQEINKKETNKKTEALRPHTEDGSDQFMTTDHGLRINDDQNSLKAGDRGPTLLEDFIMREKIMHFDHERIPERIVHARGSAAHGYFQLYESMAAFTRAKFLTDTSTVTPVFVRFSTVAGFRGSSDLARDVRGFAVKFYTQEGNYDLVGNNIPVFFIQDAIKFPDLIHAVKPEPHNEIPQAASAHDTFWDFVSLMPESMHMIMWAMSDRAIPRSLRMMEGFGVHTFRFINEKGKAFFVKFHWKPLLGIHSVAWEEAQQISGKDPDFHRRDLHDAIESGAFPEWELGVQIVDEKDEHKFEFDLLDPTKLIPEELVPVRRIGKMVLNRNPDNFFAETEQVAFHPANLVPGIDFSNDPLLQGRLFSYTDTQLSRLGGPNFHEIPINRPVVPVHNNQRDGHMRQIINKGEASYHPNSIGGGCPFQAKMAEGGFTSYTERIDASKVRVRSQSFFDHFSQATLFFNSQSAVEQDHLVNALRFELGKLERAEIRERVVGLLTQVDMVLASRVAQGLGIKVPAKPIQPVNGSIPADGNPKNYQPHSVKQKITNSPALSMAGTIKNTIKTRQVAVLLAEGFNEEQVDIVKRAITGAGGLVKIIAPGLGLVKGMKGVTVAADQSLLTASSVLFDAVYIPGGTESISLLKGLPDAVDFIRQAFKHCKAIGAGEDAATLLTLALPAGYDPATDKAILFQTGSKTKGGAFEKDFIAAIANHRYWEREKALKPA